MTVEPAIQAEFERNLVWKRLWPRCFFGLVATIEIILGLVIFFTEIFNIAMDFWYTNIFGGIWLSVILLINWILLYTTVCCATTVRASTCTLIWNLITLLALGVVIAFDIVFILNPYTCVLTPTCTSQSEVISLNYIMNNISPFKNYSIYDSKKLFLEIQVGCAGLAFIFSAIYVIIYIVCKKKLRNRTGDVQPIYPPIAPTRVPTSQNAMRIGRPPPIWTSQGQPAPYAPY